ncbi:hypothetical protein E5357_17475 [Hominisplanchenecus murintestinalis]|uniref:Uncharacterized protein n=1 Tax=Hominisplanchenecus murintestinalis TaxID=2941517 RepID=A0AC61QUZ6_9FIRM|nr:hypothetical protein [Hominisplanchenecus murintestinalis]TGX95890.1 hypothetical protein E5357_17475 [Hominisplanchenecus murintestinalis]
MQDLFLKTERQIDEAIEEFKKKGLLDADCNLFREDMLFGIPIEIASRYMTSDLSTTEKKLISKAIRSRYPEEIIELMLSGDMDNHKMEAMLQAYESGVSVEDVLDIAKNNSDAYSMSEAFAKLKETLNHATESIQSEPEIPEELKEMLTKLSNLMDGIGENSKHYDELLQKLDGMNHEEPSDAVNALKDQLNAKDEKISSLEDEIKGKNQQIMDITNQLKDKEQEANYSSKSNEDLEQQLSDQQDKLNNALNRANALENEVKKLNKQIETLKELPV